MITKPAPKRHTGSTADLADLGFGPARILALTPPRYAAACLHCAAMVELPANVAEVPTDAIRHHRWHNDLAATIQGRL